MLECLILGDSIAVGVKQFDHSCELLAHPGWNSQQWNSHFNSQTLAANTVVISLGSNDNKHTRTEHELNLIRDRIKGKKVFWVLPHGNLAAGGIDIRVIEAIVRKIAKANGDQVLPIRYVQADHMHPSWRGYKEIVSHLSE